MHTTLKHISGRNLCPEPFDAHGLCIEWSRTLCVNGRQYIFQAVSALAFLDPHNGGGVWDTTLTNVDLGSLQQVIQTPWAFTPQNASGRQYSALIWLSDFGLKGSGAVNPTASDF